VYTTFSAALRGGATIRAFTGVSEKFLSSAHKSIDTQQRASLAALAASTWLGLRLQIVAGVIAALVGGLAVVQHVGLLPGAAQATSAGFVGLSLAYALPITGLLNGLLTCGAETEQEMVSVERIAEYINKSESLSQQQCSTTTTLENDSISSSSSSADTNATRGASIVFENVWMKYTTSSPFVLFNFNVVLQPGTHAGLCGRTGAGKSSAVSCLLRLAEINSGRILVDGVDIKALPLCTLRSAIGFIPQSPFIFSGTVAENVDPVGKYSSDAIVDALQQVGLWPVLKQALGNTTTDHRNGGGGGASNGGGGGASNDAASEENQDDDDENAFLMLLPKEEEETEEARKVLNLKLGNQGGIGLSQGQQQMLCLARVVVQRQNLKVVCLDEASAAVDPATAESMQRVIKACFKGCTIIEVAHRLRSVAECDVIYVVDKGQVAESGRPKELAEDSRSLFAGMLREQADKGGCILM
jgi:ATP-binding cassette subfamily C (CFTR/MRP) protein 10